MVQAMRKALFGAAAAALLFTAGCGGGGGDEDAARNEAGVETRSSQTARNDATSGSGASDEIIRAGSEGIIFEARAATAPRAAPEETSRFEYLRYAIDTEGEAPQACLSFSEPLDPAVDYSPYVALEPAAPIALAVDGQSLCIGGLSFGEERTIVLREGLPSAEGETLSAEETTTLDFGDRPAFVGFSGNGVILPRIDADGLAIETVNVESVYVRILRVNENALPFRTVSEGYEAAQRDYEWLPSEEDPRDVSEVLWTGEMETPGEANAPTITVFPLAETIERLEPGAYFVEVYQALADDEEDLEFEEYGYERARARRWLMVTDLALTSYRGADGLTVVARSLQSAEAVEGARVRLVSHAAETLAEVETDASGRASFPAALLRGERGMRPRMLAAYGPDGDYALLDLERPPVDLSNEGVSGRTAPAIADGFIYFERGIYRPGETVHATALIRDAGARALVDRAGSLVVYGPNGIETHRQRFDAAEAAGAVTLDYETPRQAARGQWRMTAEIDGVGVVARATFQVEDFIPQRIALTLDADAETPIGAGETRAVQTSVRFLYGAPGAGLPVDGDARIQVDPRPFDDFTNFRFGRHDEEFREVAFDLAETVADGAGSAVVMIDPGSEDVSSSHPLRIRAVIAATEPGGRVVRDDVRVPYRPRALYVGIRPNFDGRARRNQSASFDVVALDRLGARQASRLEWRLLRIDWTYDWYRSEGGGWRWRRSREIVHIEDGVVDVTAENHGSLSTRELDWGDYQLVVTDPETQASASVGFWAGYGGYTSEGVEAPDRVRVAAPDEAPQVGETAVVSILPPYAGVAEIVLANESVIESRSVDVPEDGAQVEFEVTEDWGPGAYVMVSVFTPRDPVSRPRPRRAVGVAHIGVDMAARTIELSMDAPELARPRGPLTVNIEAAEGSAGAGAFVTLAAVDEGILQLTRFQSPDPTDWFYGRRRLAVELRDDYGRLLDPNQGAAAPVRSGGDQIGGAGLTVVPTRTVALFSGPIAFDASGHAQVTLDIPDFNGELRLMAVAWSQDGLGAASQPMTVRDEVPAELIMPRFLAPGDESRLTATLDNVEGEAGTYDAEISAGDAIAIAGGDTVSFDLDAGEREDRLVTIAAGEEAISEVGLSVTGPGGYAVSRTYPIQIRSPYLPVTRVDRSPVSPGESYAPPSNAFASFAPGSGEMTVSFSAIPMDAAALYQALDRYPYGCSEQVTSRAMPLLYADQIASLAGVERSGDADRRIQDSIESLLSRQAADGAIGLWRVGDRGSTPWLGAYIVDFLARAQAEGHSVPRSALDRAYAELADIAENNFALASGYDAVVRTSEWNPDTRERMRHRSQAYAMYVLARVGRADRSRLRYMHDEQLETIESPLARAHLAAALSFVGDRARARNAFLRAEDAIGYRNDGDYYQTPRRDMAGILALAAEAGESEMVERLAERVANELPEPNRLTTQELSFMLLAAHALAGSGEELQVSASGAGVVDEPGRLYSFDEAALTEGGSFTNEGLAPVWRTTITRGAPTEAPPAAVEGIAVVKEYRSIDGESVKLSEVMQGDRIIVSITVFPRQQRLTPAVIVDLLPAGFEIEGVLRPEDGGDTGPYAWLGDVATPRIAEARDDRFVAAIDLTNQQPVTMGYVVRAVTPGVYAVPGAVAEDMYRPDVFGRSEPDTLTVSARAP